MNIRSLYCLTITVFLLLPKLYSQEVVTGNTTYLEMCKKAVENPYYFENFRSTPEYEHVLEIGFGGESAAYLMEKGSKEVLSKMDAFSRLDEFGNPTVKDYPSFGKFSGTTLRYIVIADQITKLFTLPKDAKIVEIGAGFGGQCYILSQLQLFSKYFIYDLPEVESLVETMMRALSVENVFCLPTDSELPEKKVDLLISNYAFSEFNREAQMSYFERVLKKADRGYIIFNQLNTFDSLTVDEFIEVLQKHNMNPKLQEVPIFTYQGNVLITWDKTTGS